MNEQFPENIKPNRTKLDSGTDLDKMTAFMEEHKAEMDELAKLDPTLIIKDGLYISVSEAEGESKTYE